MVLKCQFENFCSFHLWGCFIARTCNDRSRKKRGKYRPLSKVFLLFCWIPLKFKAVNWSGIFWILWYPVWASGIHHNWKTFNCCIFGKLTRVTFCNKIFSITSQTLQNKFFQQFTFQGYFLSPVSCWNSNQFSSSWSYPLIPTNLFLHFDSNQP